MLYMICRNKVKDFKHWKKVFDSHPETYQHVGIKLVNMWQVEDDPNNVFFMFSVESKEKALTFVNAPESAQAGVEAGVINGEYYFINETE